MKGRTVILVSHHVQLCWPGADYIVTLENGRVIYSGDRNGFQKSGALRSLVQSEHVAEEKPAVVPTIEKMEDGAPSISDNSPRSESSSIAAASAKETNQEIKKSPRKLIEDEARAVGRVKKDVWATYFKACGTWVYWSLFGFIFLLATLGPVAKRSWLMCVVGPLY
jgi:ABC-type multidrug transport system ATPase subunit